MVRTLSKFERLWRERTGHADLEQLTAPSADVPPGKPLIAPQGKPPAKK